MGHATHFLERLDRVDDRQVERALALYNDADLLRETLAAARLPDGAERVAISLDDDVRGPFVIVTREGRFVTCLGEGMEHDLHVITRERFAVAASRIERMRTKLARIAELEDDEGKNPIRGPFARFTAEPERMCREDIAVLARFEPLYRKTIASALVRVGGEVEKRHHLIAGMRPDKLSSAQGELATTWARAAWSVSTLVALHGLEGGKRVADLEASGHIDREDADTVHRGMTYLPFALGLVPHASRSLFCVARHARNIVGSLRRIAGAGAQPTLRLFREYGLTVAGLASKSVRGEARKAIMSGAASEPDASVAEIMRDLGASLDSFFEDDGEAGTLEMASRGARFLVASYADNPDEPQPFASDQDVPVDVALAAMLSLPISWLEYEESAHVFVYGLPYLAKCSIEDLYLPREHAWACSADVTPPEAIKLANTMLRERRGGRPAPVVREAPKVGRNDPCTCGSGKKYKRCCGHGA